MKEIIIPSLILFALALVFGVILALASKKLAVVEDEKVIKIQGLLSGANCGACGYPGCAGFAVALAEGKADINSCTSTSLVNKEEIAQLIGGKVCSSDKNIVVDACCGGNRCQNKYEYQGYGNCLSIELLAGGNKACPTGCMGMGSCVDVCAFDAIEVNELGFSEINHDKCTVCGQCVKVCPKNVLKILPSYAKIYIACSSRERGKAVSSVCSVGCIGCGLCARVCPEGAIVMEDNLPIIDYKKCIACGKCVEKCPTKVIKWIEAN